MTFGATCRSTRDTEGSQGENPESTGRNAQGRSSRLGVGWFESFQRALECGACPWYLDLEHLGQGTVAQSMRA